MSIAQFSLVNKVPILISRHEQDTYVKGKPVEGAETLVTIQANVHPFSDYQVMMLPEADRTKSWVWLFTSDLVRQKKEGVSGNGADRFDWLGDTYEVRAVQTYVMRIQDHREARCVRVELSPN